jgi:beta-glucanase (GH16 family)
MSASRARRWGGRLAIVAVSSAFLLAPLTGLTGSTSANAASTARVAAESFSAEPAAARAAVAAAKKSSWKTVRTLTFSGSALPDGCHPYGDRYRAGKNAWSSKDVKVSGGLLKLTLEKKKTSGQPYTAGAVGCWDSPQKYGRYEIKAKIPAGRGIDSSFTLLPAKVNKNNATQFTGIELLAPGPQTAYLTNGYGSKSESARVTGKFAGAFHDYVIEWAPKHILISVDSKVIFYSDRAYTGARWLGLVLTSGDALTGVPDADTKLPARLQIERITVSSYTGVPPKARAVTVTPSPSPSVTAPPSSAAVIPKAPARTEPSDPSALESTSSATGPALAGGVWPWLLGGSLIAVFAIASLNYPHQRRARRDRLIRH